jgi:predicted  nucleic acid-binding Zn-ribbon protein
MNARATELQAAENNLKQLMAEVTRGMDKAQEAIAKIALKNGTSTAATESTPSSASAEIERARALIHPSSQPRGKQCSRLVVKL